MGTAAFDRLWDDEPPKKKPGKKSVEEKGFDTLWDEQGAPKESLKLDVRAPSESTKALAYNRPDATGDAEAIGNTPAALALIAAQAIPGAERFEALMGSVGSKFTKRPLTYKESLDALRSETDPIPTAIKLAVQAPALIKSAAMLPFSPAKAGAMIGGADQLLSADEMSPSERGLRTLAGAGIGVGVGKGADMLATGARVARAPNTAKQLAELEEVRASSSGPLYRKAATQGAGAATTPKIQAFVQSPDIAEIVAELRHTNPRFGALAADDPQMLDAVYKVLSDRAALAGRQAEAVTPSRPNIGRFRREGIKAQKDAALDAFDTTMPSYRTAVQDFAEKSRLIDATQRGHDAIRSRLNRNLPMAKSLKKTSPESFDKYLKGATPEEAQAAEQGILGGTKAAFGQSIRKSGIPALHKSGTMLRRTNSREQRAIDQLIRLGLLSATPSTP